MKPSSATYVGPHTRLAMLLPRRSGRDVKRRQGKAEGAACVVRVTVVHRARTGPGEDTPAANPGLRGCGAGPGVGPRLAPEREASAQPAFRPRDPAKAGRRTVVSPQESFTWQDNRPALFQRRASAEAKGRRDGRRPGDEEHPAATGPSAAATLPLSHLSASLSLPRRGQ
ncbi:hypothetical protein CDD83_3773 [Cordyceps sp. RAO-2017]|nr:hypothetical protein CDD83_3773 [Cordyceps sp. RAO-2017]